MAEIRSIRGADVPLPGEPDPQVIEALQGALAAALRGEVVAIAIAYVMPAERVCTRHAGASSRMALIGGIELMKRDLMREWK